MYINTVVENVYINTVVENVYIYIYFKRKFYIRLSVLMMGFYCARCYFLWL